MRITVCQFPEGAEHLQATWKALVKHTSQAGSQLVLLPEMPFSSWLSAEENPDPQKWRESIEQHRRWLPRLDELGAEVVASSCPVDQDGVFYNEAFVWEGGQYHPVHRKHYLPDEAGFHEARWYQPAPIHFQAIETGLGKIGFLICTEIWFTEWARAYAAQGTHFVLCPRASAGSVDKWLVGGRAAAIMSGAWCLSSNRGGLDQQGCAWAGGAWVVEPEEGDVRAVSGADSPFITLEIDPAAADRAKHTYPRYVKE